MDFRTEASLCIFKHLFKFNSILVFLCIRFVELDGIIKQQVYISTKSINVLIFICFQTLLIEKQSAIEKALICEKLRIERTPQNSVSDMIKSFKQLLYSHDLVLDH